jgi:DNA (cytosine-5)-methyltransferase 1
MNILSLCSGYGGLDLAVEAVVPGARTRWVAEIDGDASAVLAARFPDAPNLGDLKQIDWSALAGQVDIITAGYPCQPFSNAGRRKGVEDERHIWPWIIDGIRLVGPRLVVLENVRGHLRRGFDVVLGDLAEAGFNAEWTTLRASDVGAPHRRDRLFVVAHPDGQSAWWDSGTAPRPETEGRREPDGSDRLADGRRALAVADSVRCERLEAGDSTNRGVDIAAGHNTDRRGLAVADTDGRSGRSGPGLCEAGPAGQRRGRPANVHRQTDWQRFTPAVRRWEHIMGRSAPAPLVAGTKRLNARLCEWMMGLPDGWVTDILPNRKALKVIGNGVCPQQAAAAVRMLLCN